jgi:hypothetical protein
MKIKKSIFISAVVAATSPAAFAALETSGVIGTDKFTTADCPNQLAADPNIKTSAGVTMAFGCITGAPAVALSACHTAGLVKSRSQKVACNDGTDPLLGKAPACDGTDPATKSGAAFGFNYVTTSGATINFAQTGGGSLGAATVADKTVCDAAGTAAKAVLTTGF